ncbi:MAG: gliding motility-associated C-terminal domain-containing protein [Ferruginibacter sp.]
MSKLICYIVLTLLLSSVSIAQQLIKPVPDKVPVSIIKEDAPGMCGLGMSLKRLRHDPRYKAREEKMNREILNLQRPLLDSIIVPVVFHIINQDPDAMPDQVILNGLKELNDAFAKRGNYINSKGVDTKIRFCLAKKDPGGGNTSGITRTKSFFSANLNPVIEDARLKNLVQWDPARYINIWYINSMELEGSAEFVCGKWIRTYVAGYSTMPPGGDSLDGIVLIGLDKLLVHEMGHYLGLYHTFEGRNCANSDCTTDGDKVCDTPPDNSQGNSISCNDPENSCGTDTLSNYSNGNFTTDVPDQIANFMDYGNTACQNEFTQGQADRMVAAILTQRSGLLQNECDKPCSEDIVAAFKRNNPYPVTGSAVTFTNQSSGGANFQWMVNNLAAATSKDLNYTFSAPGKYKVTLKVFNNDSCYAMHSDFVIVNCGVIARFYPDKQTIASQLPRYPDSIRFTNTSENATSFRWMMSNDQGMDEQLISTDKDFLYLFPVPAQYFIRLIATNGTCTDTTNTFTVSVLDPTQDGIAYMSTVDCYEQTKVRVSFYVCNYGYATIPPNTPISFYDADPRLGNVRKLITFYLPDSVPGKCCGLLYTQIIDVHQPGLNVLYMVFNDAGTTMPLALPNTSLPEINYANNVTVTTNFRFKATILPAAATLEPGDTLQLTGQAGPGVVTSYTWNPALNLSCTSCTSPYLIADSDRVKRMIATSQLGCIDTAYVDIKVPPANDYTIDINDVQCAANDRLYVNFTLYNKFKRGVIPKGMTVSFYDADPATTTAHLLPPVFSVPDTVFGKEFIFSVFIKGVAAGKIYAVVNDSGKVVPVQLPNNSLLPEKDYSNNGAEFLYSPETLILQPQDTTVPRTSALPIKINTTIYNSASTIWSNGNGYTLSCNRCPVPVATISGNSLITAQTANKYGCLLTGNAVIKILPPDMKIKIIATNCYSNSTTLVKFEICMNNNYDSVFADIPVSFYESLPSDGPVKPLSPVFYTTAVQKGNCNIYQHIIATPGKGILYAVVNDKGTNANGSLEKVFDETNYDNNTDNSVVTNFNVTIDPADTAIARSGTVQLVPHVEGGTLSSWMWQQDPFLSCQNCLTNIVTPLYTRGYTFIARNEYACVDTAHAIVKIFTGGVINLPSAFSPNRDGLNDIFYILAGQDISLVKEFSVFNRWGQKVFDTKNILPNDPRYGWDGTHKGVAAEPGTYVYIVRIQGADGKDKAYKGTIILLR